MIRRSIGRWRFCTRSGRLFTNRRLWPFSCRARVHRARVHRLFWLCRLYGWRVRRRDWRWSDEWRDLRRFLDAASESLIHIGRELQQATAVVMHAHQCSRVRHRRLVVPVGHVDRLTDEAEHLEEGRRGR